MISSDKVRESYLAINDKAVGKFIEEQVVQAKRPLDYTKTYSLLLRESLERLDEYIKSKPEEMHPEVEKINKQPIRAKFNVFLEITQNEKKLPLKDVWPAYTKELTNIQAQLFTLFAFFGTETNYAMTKKGLFLPRCAATYIPMTPLEGEVDNPDVALCDFFIDPSKASDSFMSGWMLDEDSIDDTKWQHQQFNWNFRIPIVCPRCLLKRFQFRTTLSKEQLAKLQKDPKPTAEILKNIGNMKSTIDKSPATLSALETYVPKMESIKYVEKEPEAEEEEDMEVDGELANGNNENDVEVENVVKRVDEDEETMDKVAYDALELPETPGKGIFDAIREEEEEEEEEEKNEKNKKVEKTPTKQTEKAKSPTVPSSPAAPKTPTKTTGNVKPKAQKKLDLEGEEEAPKSKEIKKSKPAAKLEEEEEEAAAAAMQVEKQTAPKKAETPKTPEPKQPKQKAKKETEEKPKPAKQKKEKASEDTTATTASKKRKRADEEEEEEANGTDAETKTKKPPAKKQKTSKANQKKAVHAEEEEAEVVVEGEEEEVETKPKKKAAAKPKAAPKNKSSMTESISKMEVEKDEFPDGFGLIEKTIMANYSSQQLPVMLKKQFLSLSKISQIFIKDLILGEPSNM